jgi:hypothetical protein
MPMHSNPCFRSCAASLCSLLYLLVITTVLGSASLCSAKTAKESAPPIYLDCAHFHNGCHISAVTYLARFAADFPEERGQPVIAALRNASGVIRPHTVALVTWRGEWWCRDEFYGVFPIHCAASGEPDLQNLPRYLQAHASFVARHHRVKPFTEGATLSFEQRLRDATDAAEALPIPNTIFWVHQDGVEVPVVFFRPGQGIVAIYDPAHGTAVAECTLTEDVRVAAAIAVRLGYRADGIRADISSARGGLMVAASSARREFVR